MNPVGNYQANSSAPLSSTRFRITLNANSTAHQQQQQQQQQPLHNTNNFLAAAAAAVAGPTALASFTAGASSLNFIPANITNTYNNNSGVATTSSSSGGEGNAFTTVSYCSPVSEAAAAQRYGGALVRISELKQRQHQQGGAGGDGDAHLGTGNRSAQVLSSLAGVTDVGVHSERSTAAASYNHLSLDVPFSPGLTSPSNFSSHYALGGKDVLAEHAASRLTSSRGRRATTASSARGRRRGSAASTVDSVLLADTGDHGQWYTKGGRREFVYGGKSYRGKAAYKLWKQVKARASGFAEEPTVGGTTSKPSRGRGRKGKTKKIRRSGGTKAAARASTSKRTATMAGSTSLMLPAWSGSMVSDSSRGASRLQSLPTAQYSPVLLDDAPPLRPLVPVSSARGLAAVAAVNRDTTGSDGTPPAGLAPLFTTARATAPHCASSHHRDQTRVTAPQSSGTWRALSEVMEITDSDDGDDSSSAQSGVVQRPQRKHSRTGAMAPQQGGSLKAPHGAVKPTPAWPVSYFRSSSSSSNVSSSSSDFLEAMDEKGDDGLQGVAATATTVKLRQVDGHTVVEKDGWLYPAELLSTLTLPTSSLLNEQPQTLAGAKRMRAEAVDDNIPLSQLFSASEIGEVATRVPAGYVPRDGRLRTATASFPGMVVLGRPAFAPQPQFPLAAGQAPAIAQLDRYTERADGSHFLDGLPDAELEGLFEACEEIGGFRYDC